MIDEQRAAQWTEDATSALIQHYGKNETIAHLATIILTLLADRTERERFCRYLSVFSTPLGMTIHDR